MRGRLAISLLRAKQRAIPLPGNGPCRLLAEKIPYFFKVSFIAEAAESTCAFAESDTVSIESFLAEAEESTTFVRLSFVASVALSLLHATKPRLATANKMKSFFIVM